MSIVKIGDYHGALEKALVNGVLSLVRQVGVEKVSLRSFSTDLGVSPGATSHHLPHKDGRLQSAGFAALKSLADRQELAVREAADELFPAVEQTSGFWQ